MQTLRDRLDVKLAQQDAGKVSIAFGSRKLFRAQFDLAANGYASHAEWLRDWQAARSSQFMVLGSKDETAGCQGCVATRRPDGTLGLRLRLPDALQDRQGKYIEIEGVRFAYGMRQVLEALESSCVVERKSKSGQVIRALTGTALTWRFVRDHKGWRALVSVSVSNEIRSDKQLGAVGMDFNADHIALAHVDRFGNLKQHQRINTPLQHKRSQQRQAILGDAVKVAVGYAARHKLPIIAERLDFVVKKSQMEAMDPARARMLSALAYRQFDAMLRAAAFRAGVHVIDVNPAFTSVIGAINFAQVRGISVHLGAATAIARRGLGLSERPIGREGLLVAPTRQGGHVTLALPERNRARHVWTQWSAVRSRLRAALREHHRCGAAKTAPPPLSDVLQAVRATGGLAAKSRSASRQPHCSAGASFPDVPF